MDNQEPRVTEQAAAYILRSKATGEQSLVWPSIAANYSAQSYDKIALTRQAAPEAPTEKIMRDALLNIRDYRTDVDSTIAARSMRFHAEIALDDAAAPATQQAGVAVVCNPCTSNAVVFNESGNLNINEAAATTASASLLTQWQGILTMRAEGVSVAGHPARDAALSQFLNTLPADVAAVEIVYRRAPAPSQEAAHPITDAELRDPEYMRHYVEECSSTLGEVLAENKRLRAALAQQDAAQASGTIYVRQATLDHIAESIFVKHEITVRTEPNEGWVALAAQATHAGAIMLPLSAGLPLPDDHDRVLVYTEGVDFAGEQYFDIKTEDLWEQNGDRTEVADAATHWMPLPRAAIAASANGEMK